jgi:hypothetical protein
MTQGQQSRKSIADSVRDFLIGKYDEDPDLYARAIATKFVEVTALFEKILRKQHERISMLESLLEAQPSQPHADPSSPPGAPPAVVGAQARQPRSAAGRMVRLDAMGAAMSPEDQAAEEKADMSINGEVDMSRYVPADSVPQGGFSPGNGQLPTSQPATPPPAQPGQ